MGSVKLRPFSSQSSHEAQIARETFNNNNGNDNSNNNGGRVLFAQPIRRKFFYLFHMSRSSASSASLDDISQ